MYRLPVQALLLGCAGLLLGMQGCSNRTATIAIGDDSGPRDVAVQGKEKPTGADVPFRLPADQAGTLLARVLPPTARPGALANPTRSAPPVVPSPRLAEPGLDLPAVTPDLPRLPEVVKRVPSGPEFVQQEALEDSFLLPELPARPAFAIGERTRISSPDASVPPPLPVLAQPVLDRVSLDDATMEVSTAAVLSTAMPERSTPAPYQRMTVPEPFENRDPLTLSMPAEVTVPEVEGPRPPK
jgi:hypothetical protein